MSKSRVVLSPPELHQLNRKAHSGGIRAADARRARLLLLLAEGKTYDEIRRELGCSSAYISRWKKRFLEERLAGLYPRYRGAKPTSLTPELEARILSWTCRPPVDGSRRWSTRRLAEHLGINHMLVHRVWKRIGYRRRRVRREALSVLPDLGGKTLDIVGLYLNPPAHVAVFGLEEDAVGEVPEWAPSHPLSRDRESAFGIGGPHHRALSMLEAMEERDADCERTPVDSYNSAEFVAFLEEIVAHQPPSREVRVVANDLSVHKSERVGDFLKAHARVHVHYLPTYSSWLRQLELWLSELERDVVRRSGSGAVDRLGRRLLHFVREHADQTSPFKWAHSEMSSRDEMFDLIVTTSRASNDGGAAYDIV